jgi:hypothetical protein
MERYFVESWDKNSVVGCGGGGRCRRYELRSEWRCTSESYAPPASWQRPKSVSMYSAVALSMVHPIQFAHCNSTTMTSEVS